MKTPPFTVDVSSPYGAPKGRRSEKFATSEFVHLRRVPLNSGGYDAGGAYWGHGAPLWCAFSASGGVAYTRACSREEAKENVRASAYWVDGCAFKR